MPTNRIQTGIRFEPVLLYKITHVAKQNKRSLNAQLEFLAQECVSQYEAEHGTIQVDEELCFINEGDGLKARPFLFLDVSFSFESFF